MRTKSFLFILFFLGLTLNTSAQKTEQFFFDKAAKEYYNGNMEAARTTIDLGLRSYPGNQKLLKLKETVGVDPIAVKWQKYNQNIRSLENQGFEKGSGANGDQKKSIVDPNGVTHVFHKTINTAGIGATPPGPTEGDKWKNFNKQEKSILSSGYQQGDGEPGDFKKTLQDPDGEIHYYFKKKIITIKSGFKVASQNSMEWSDELKNSADKITITFKTKNGASESFNVSGKNHFEFQSFNRQFDQVFCKVILDVKLKDNTVVKGNLILDNIWCLCSL